MHRWKNTHSLFFTNVWPMHGVGVLETMKSTLEFNWDIDHHTPPSPSNNLHIECVDVSLFWRMELSFFLLYLVSLHPQNWPTVLGLIFKHFRVCIGTALLPAFFFLSFKFFSLHFWIFHLRRVHVSWKFWRFPKVVYCSCTKQSWRNMREEFWKVCLCRHYNFIVCMQI